MHIHDAAEEVVEKHPLILDLEDRLRDEEFAPADISFLCRHVCFAYPRTLWVKWNVDTDKEHAAEDLGLRHSLDPQKTGKFLGSWLAEKLPIKNIVFDLSGVTIFDAEKMGGLFAATTADSDGAKYYVCSGEMAARLREVPAINADAIFTSERAMLMHLRHVSVSQRCVVPLPECLSLLTLDQALRRCAADAKIRNRDVIAFDFANVKKISFDAHCMFAPIIHSLAHRYGILATVSNVRKKIVADISAHGSLRPMRANLIQVDSPNILRRLDPAEFAGGPFATRTFTAFELWQITAAWMARLEEMKRYYVSWFVAVGKIPRFYGQEEIDRMEEAMGDLQNILKELVDNVAAHSEGLGYLAMELNPRPKGGLSIYVGDTGIGLAKGLQRSYKFKTEPTDEEAVFLAMSLGDRLADRQQSGNFPLGGRGLEHVGLLLRRLHGTISIRTRSAQATFHPEKIRVADSVRSDLYPVDGTHIHIHIPTKWKAL
jgi:hypothetical protein